MIPFKNRFHGHGGLRYVYKNGQAERTHLLTLKYVTNPHRKQSRFAVVISKKVLKSAVGRNRVRRRLYEIIRERIDRFESPSDVVFLVFSSEIKTLPQDELVQLVDQLLTASSLYKKDI